MKKTLFIFAALFFWMADSATAQLSTIETDAQTFKYGNRAQAGDRFASFAIPITSGSASLALFNTLSPGNVLTFGKYNTDNEVSRIAIRLSQSSGFSKGSLGDSADFPGNPALDNNKFKTSTSRVILAPGYERHFSSSNVFDVYSGADFLIGWVRSVSTSNVEARNGDFTNLKRTSQTFNVGLGFVAGASVWISNLPISVGLEYGWSALWNLGGQDKYVSDRKVGGTETNLKWSEQDEDPFGNPDPIMYEKLSTRSFEMDNNHDVKLVFRVYFRDNSEKKDLLKL